MSANVMIAKLFHARTAAHMAHLQTNSFAAHKALDEFYNEIVEVADAFAETYQGIFGIIYDYPAMGLPTGKPVVWINELREWLKTCRADCCKGETTLENLHDNITGLCASIVYKLKFLDNPAMQEADEPDEYLKMKSWK